MGHFQYECPTGVNYAEYEENEELVLMAYLEEEPTEFKGHWFLDSACSNHMTGTRSWFTKLDENIKHAVRLGNGKRLAVRGIGDIRLEIGGLVQVITNVYFVPELTSNLMSVGQLQEKGVKVVIEKGECCIHHPQRGVIIRSQMTKNRMFVVHGKVKAAPSQCLQASEVQNTQVWHKRFAHVNHKAIRTMQYKKMVNGLPIVSGRSEVCETCNVGKQHRVAIPKKSFWRSSEKLQLIHTDLCGPITPSSQSGKRCVTRSLDDKVPEERWSGEKPNVDYFRVFGCIGHVHVPAQLRLKLDARSHKCVLFGISTVSKAYRMYDPIKRKIVISRDVIFDEEKEWDWGKEFGGDQELVIEEEILPMEVENTAGDATVEGVQIEEQPKIQDATVVPTQSETTSTEGQDHTAAPNQNADQIVGNTAGTSSQNDNPAMDNTDGASTRNRRAPTWMENYESGEGLSDEEEEVGFAMYSSSGDPTTFEEASQDARWVKAMEDEISAIERNNTWELVSLPTGTKAIGVKWVFKTKLNEEGNIDKLKARLVVKGYSQKKGIDYEEVFAPVARWDTIRTILALSAQRNWKVYQLDVKSAFLNGELKETVFVEQPQGFIKEGEESKVYKLNRALYGLKQAPRAWFNRIERYFKREGFKQNHYDHTLFVKRVWNKILVVSLYVDDLIYAGNDKMMCESFKCSMQKEFEMTDLGVMKFFLGVEVQQTEAGIYLCQKKNMPKKY
ncbi:putative RNA-directed DNA polymerase [Helianthus debilis subsp. tardiflorus]